MVEYVLLIGDSTLRILVIGSCGKKKSIQSTDAPTCNNLASIDDIVKFFTCIQILENWFSFETVM